MERMIGKTPTEITQTDDTITFAFSGGEIARFHHYQWCCENVYVDDVNGDWSDLIGVPLLVAEERDGEYATDEYSESVTWTFYAFRSINGSVDVRWCGTSNGYYSESVDFDFEDAAPVASEAEDDGYVTVFPPLKQSEGGE